MFRQTKAAYAWDIDELKNIGFSTEMSDHIPFFSGSPRCERTVTFKGKCYYASAVIYVMWGKVNRLCTASLTGNLGLGGALPWSWNATTIAVGFWKASQTYGLNLETSQANAFAQYGYFGSMGFTSPVAGCNPNSSQSPPLSWSWNPHLKGGHSK